MNRSNKYFILDEKDRGFIRRVYFGVLAFFRYVYYSFIYLFVKTKEINKKYNVAVCSIFKNEAVYLKEWIEFNHHIGVDHFYLYNNNSDDNYLEVLKPYIDSNLVTLEQWPENQKQMEAYKDAIKKYSSETKWLGFIDIDEFIVPKNTNNLYDFLKKFKDKGSVRIYWRIYGSSGYVYRDLKELVVEDFVSCWPKYSDVGKCFYNTAFDFDFNSNKNRYLHHDFWAKYKHIELPPVNCFNKVCVNELNIAKSNDFPIQINHYFTKSYNEYLDKCSKGDVYYKENPHDENYFYQHEMYCTDIDYSAYKYLTKLKRTLNNDTESK